MKRRAAAWSLALVLALLAAFFLFAPGIAERRMNVVDGEALPEVSAEARALHASLTIVDLHADTLLWQRDLLDRADQGHVDLLRLTDGNVALQVLSSVTRSPAGLNNERNSADARDDITLLAIGQLQPVRTWTSLLERTLWHGEKFDRAIAGSNGHLIPIRQREDLDRLLARRATGDRETLGAMLSIEGLHNLEGDLANLTRLRTAGFRMAGLTHFFDNELAGSMHGEAKGGLTPFGREVVRRLEELGMVVDIAHCSHRCVADVLAMARRPVISSHGGVQATCPGNRNLSDDEIRAIAATGGVVGIGYWDSAVCDISPAGIVRAMAHVRDLVGIGHVALGSDFDGSVTTRFDTSQLVQITAALLIDGWTEEDIRKVMGLNAVRLLRETLTPPSVSVPLAPVP